MRNLQEVIPAFFVGPGGSRLTPEQIAARQQVAKSLLEKATDTSPNAGGWASVAAKGLMGLSAGLQEGRAERAAQANADANAAVSQSLLASLTGSMTPSSGGGWTGMAPTADVAPSLSVASALMQPAQMVENQPPVPGLQSPDTVSGLAKAGIDPVSEVMAAAPASGNSTAQSAAKSADVSFSGKSPVEIASSLLGKGEVPDRSTLMEFFQNGGQNLDPATTAWCAAFVNSSLGAAGIQGTGKLNARSFLDWGTPVDQPQEGDIAVLTRGDPNGWQGHVGFFKGQNPDGTINILGGNQGNQVSISPYAAERVLGYRRPPSSNAMTPSTEVAQALSPQPSMGTNYFPPAPQAGGLDPAVIQALSDPNVSPQNKQIAMTLVQQYQARQQAAQEQAMEQAAQQQELERRRSIAQAKGFDPTLAEDEIAYKAAVEAAMRGRQTQTVNGKVVDVNTGEVIFDAPSKPTSVEEYEYGLQNPGYFDTQERFKRAGATNIDMGQNKFEAEFGSLDAKALQEVGTAGMAARRNLSRIDSLESLLNEAPTGMAAALAQKAGEFGIKTEGLDQIQAAQAVINSLVPEQRQPGSGPMSDADLELFKQSLPRIINQPGGNKIIIDTMRAIAQYDAEGAAVIQRLRSGEINRAEAFDQLYNRPNPLEAFKAPPNEPPPSEDPLPPQKITSKDQFDRLPSGTKFIDPQGNVRIKP